MLHDARQFDPGTIDWSGDDLGGLAAEIRLNEAAIAGKMGRQRQKGRGSEQTRLIERQPRGVTFRMKADQVVGAQECRDERACRIVIAGGSAS
ncbi:hypothetical protein [Microvirga lotononidis]|uniref:Uncharacterized protein n=1 Tax=Microvirga lotononidis TaxID=864069 RepID=I4YYE5_9HYPH|nr:hypothetical protein [Microvirga lotononidis]EIM28987.1 hypothetical protein MicloDRAFT_00026350 [Microvirga lotononidis]WQO26902.1 hypothetical protein U0023_19905 [Microvirga lotononidis]